MKNIIINLAVISIAILSGSDAFASIHQNHKTETFKLTETTEKVQTNQNNLQSHSERSIIWANHNDDLVITSSAHHVNLINEHHFLDVSLHCQRIKKQLNLESHALAYSANQLGKTSQHDLHISNVHENIGEITNGSG